MTQTSTKMMPTPAVEEVLDILRDLEEDQDIFRQAIGEALLTLGGPIAKTIIWQLKARGVFLDSKIDVRVLYEHLGQTVGYGANIIMIQIFENVRRLYEERLMSFDTSRNMVPRAAFKGAIRSLAKRKKSVIGDLESRGIHRHDGEYLELTDVCESLGQ